MYEFRLHDQNDTHCIALRNEIESKENVPRLYRTYFQDGGTMIVLYTTSKDIHLAIGSISFEGLGHLYSILKTQLLPHRTAMMLIVEKNQRSAILVTKTSSSGQSEIYHLSPAH